MVVLEVLGTGGGPCPPGGETTCIICDDNNIHHLQIFTLNYQDTLRLVTGAGKQMMLTLNVVTIRQCFVGGQ